MQTVSEQEGQGGRKGEGGVTFFFFEQQQGWWGCGGWGLEVAIPTQCRRDGPPDVPLRFGTVAQGTRRKGRAHEDRRKRTEEEAMLNPFSTRHALSPHSSLLHQSGYPLDPQGCLSASLHTNSSLAHSLEHEQRTKLD